MCEINFNGFDKIYKYKIVYLKILLLLFVSCGEIIEDYDVILNKPYPDVDFIIESVLYRGQSNYSYGLLPSIYRGLDFNGIIDQNKLLEIYKGTSMYDKYCQLFGYSSIDYNFVSFMQHATEYSPLLDFSKEKDIALIFATNSKNKNYNDYNNLDCSLYTLSLLEGNNKDVLDFTQQKVQFYKEKLKYNSKIFGTPLILCSLQDFKVNYQTCLYPTNDRMRYQQGAFLYVRKCVIANGKMFFPFSQFIIKKQRIYSQKNIKGNPVLSKQYIYRDILDRKPYYDFEYLLSPYLYFSEFNK